MIFKSKNDFHHLNTHKLTVSIKNREIESIKSIPEASEDSSNKP